MGRASQRISYYYLKPEEPGSTSGTVEERELLRVALMLNEGSSPREVVQQIFAAVQDRVPCDRIGVALLDSDGWLISKVVTSRYPVILGEGSRGRLSGSSLEPIVREQKIRVINDLEAYARAHPDSTTTAQLVAEGMRSSLTLPLIAKNQAIGVMFFTSTQTGAYDSQHVDFLRALASGVAIILERSTLTEALSFALAELKTLDQLKNNFLSNLSHELRTPLSIIVSYLQTLDEQAAAKLSPSQHDLLTTAIRAADQLDALLNDLFDFTELNAGILHLDRIELDLRPILREVAEETRPALSQAGLELRLQLPDTPLMVSADPPRIAKAVRTLLDNARKFTPAPGTITLRAACNSHHVWIEVEDSGIGIPPEAQRRIFDKFFQIQAGPTRQYGGSGLGLALAKTLVEAHDGSISVRSKPQQGSTFRITLPLATPNKTKP